MNIPEFGLAHIVAEGGPIHPDDPDMGYWGGDNNIYYERLLAYAKRFPDAVFMEYSRSPELLVKAAIEIGADKHVIDELHLRCKSYSRTMEDIINNAE